MTHPLDLCECGDHRRDHEGGEGRCLLEHSHLSCGRFELAASHPADDQEQKEEGEDDGIR